MNDEMTNNEINNAELRNNRIEELLEENLELTEEIHKMTKKIDRFVFWQKIFGTLQILIIVVPIVLGIIYLPPLLGNILNQYRELLEVGGNGVSKLNSIPTNGLLETLE